MVQQQAHMAQMYPQVHLSHFANVMPYRQFIPPLYVPPMVPGFSGNPGYPHLSNGSSYVLMPGGSSHLPANSLKYGVQQFKPYPVGSPTGFGNMQNPNGYAINAPGVVGGPTGLDDSSRIKYKDNNLYVPNPQVIRLYYPCSYLKFLLPNFLNLFLPNYVMPLNIMGLLCAINGIYHSVALSETFSF